MDKLKGIIVIFAAAIIVGIGLIFFLNSNDELEDVPIDNDYSDVSNVSVIDAKLGSDIKITQSYLMKYTINKTGVWYMSYGSISKIKVTDKSIEYTFTDGNNSIKGSIAKSNGIYEKGSKVYFVGTINLGDGSINLSTVSDEKINYSTPVEMELSEFIEHINNVRNTNFLIQGYMVTDEEEYKLFDSKSKYQSNSEAGNYFLLSMDKSFNYTGNANVTLRCNIDGTYKLRNCKLEQ